MTRLFNEPADFADEAADGFAAANARFVRRVTGGVVRVARSAEPRVVVVTGGGSGHYPAFAGLVGQGLAAGAAMGNLFASPSAQQVESVARAANEGRGILFSYGSYAGDVLNFDAAEAALNAAGIEAKTVTVTDDISSAGPGELEKRRGIAGGLFVWKCAAAAADRGDDLAAVAEVAARANARTRSFGVAFSGATLPGASEPLFSVPEGRMSLGMGIHGEPGFDETDVPTADGLAQLLVDSLLAERPDGAERAVVLLNGLGSVKYEELFVLYGNVSKRLADAGVTIVEPEVGEMVTSFDMAGVSLTLAWLDDELEQLWAAPASAPAFRKGAVDASVTEALEVTEADGGVPSSLSRASGTASGTGYTGVAGGRVAHRRGARRRRRRARRACRGARPHRRGRGRRRPRHRDAAGLGRRRIRRRPAPPGQRRLAGRRGHHAAGRGRRLVGPWWWHLRRPLGHRAARPRRRDRRRGRTRRRDDRRGYRGRARRYRAVRQGRGRRQDDARRARADC